MLNESYSTLTSTSISEPITVVDQTSEKKTTQSIVLLTKNPMGLGKKEAIHFKVIIIGDACSGKSSILLKFTSDTFIENNKPTIGVDYKIKYIKINDDMIKLKIWDTAGQERFRSIVRTYYSNSDGIILVFDPTSKNSFDDLDIWIDEIKIEEIHTNPIILVSTKSDLKNKIVISSKEVNEFINRHNDLNITYIESSSKYGQNIDDIFIELSIRMLTRSTRLTENFISTENNIQMERPITQVISSAEFEHFQQEKTTEMIANYKASCCIVS